MKFTYNSFISTEEEEKMYMSLCDKDIHHPVWQCTLGIDQRAYSFLPKNSFSVAHEVKYAPFAYLDAQRAQRYPKLTCTVGQLLIYIC